MKRIFKIAAPLLIAFIAFSPATALAFNPYGGVSCQGANSSTVCAQSTQPTGNPLYGSESLLSKAIFFIALIGGIAAVILIIIGGIQYATAAGSPERASSARRTILYALIGIAIITLAEFIVRFVINNG